MRLPKHAKRVFKGIIFDVYHWKQKLFDGSYATFEGLKRLNTVEVIPIIKNKIVLIKQQQPRMKPCYTLVGGRQERGESSLQAAKRELLEETGIKAKKFILHKSYHPSAKLDYTTYCYLAKDCTQIQTPTPDPGEKITVLHVSFKEFFRIVTKENFWGPFTIIDFFKMKDQRKLKEFKDKLFSK